MKQDQCPGARNGEAAVVKLVAARKPASRRRSTKVNGRPIHGASRQAARTTSPASREPLTRQVTKLLLLIRLAATVLTTMPITAAGSPDTIKFPAATPVAGQNAATSPDAENPSRAAREYAMAMAPAAPNAVTHPRAPGA